MISPDIMINRGLVALQGNPVSHVPFTHIAATSVPGWVALCAGIAPMASMALSFAPYPTIDRIAKDKTVGNLPLIPYSSMIANAFLWTVYGFLQGQPKVWGTNLIGLAFGLFYFCRFVQFAPSNSSPSFPGSVSQHATACLSVITATLFLITLAPVHRSTTLIGNMAVLFCMALFASPLASVKNVLETKSADSIPLPFTIATVLNCFLWSITGIFQMKDKNIILPNMIGLAFGISQIFLKMLFGNQPAPAERTQPLI